MIGMNRPGRGLTIIFIILLASTEALALGSGWYAIRVKVEHQYTDYSSFKYPPAIMPLYPDVEWQQFDPYISEFPENRTLLRVTQTFGPTLAVQTRYQFSELSEEQEQQLLFVQVAKELHQMWSFYGNGQFLNQPDYLKAWAGTIGGLYNRAGWIVAEVSLGYNLNHPSAGAEGLTVDQASNSRTLSPMTSLRYAIDTRSAAQVRWEGYYARSEGITRQSHAITGTLSHIFPTQTAVHLSERWFDSENGISSTSPSIEIAQYIFWNLTARIGYRYYQNKYDDPAAATNIDGDRIESGSLTIQSEYQVRPDLKLHMKFRRYESNQSISMNTYLGGCEWTL